ncbi:transposase [Rhodococcus jostii]|uniref:transposase n=1 Tax=Rhodococcus jostii TaxID=132919 RepID=UPI00294B4857|nr:transposase [Rhodococcus jostii]
MKNDVRDARDLANLLRTNRLPEAWIAPPPTRELRERVGPTLGAVFVAEIGDVHRFADPGHLCSWAPGESTTTSCPRCGIGRHRYRRWGATAVLGA